MNIEDIHSIELNREKPFNHKILLKDKDGNILEEMKINEVAGFEKLMEVNRKWFEALERKKNG